MSNLKSRLEWLCNLPLGEVWTEYHWREAEQIRQEVDKMRKGPTGYMHKGYWYEYLKHE